MWNHEEFNQFLRRHIHTVYRTALGFLRNPADAEDVTQTVFLQAFQKHPVFENEAHEKYWLIRVTVNACKKLCRLPWRREVPTAELTGAFVFDSPRHCTLFEIVMDLPRLYRVPLILFYYEGYSTREISEILNIAPATVRTRLARGRQALKTILTEEAASDESKSLS